MHDYPSTGLQPTNRTDRTVTPHKSSATKRKSSFSPITLFRPMALSARSHATVTPTSPPLQVESHRDQSIASSSNGPLPPFLYDDERPSSVLRKPSSTSSVDDVAGSRFQNPPLFSAPKIPFLNRKLDRSRSHKPTPDDGSGNASEYSLSSSPYHAGPTSAKASKSWTTALRARTVSSKSGSSYSQEEPPPECLLPAPSKQGTRALEDDSLKSSVSNQRVVGRGGSGSRPRVVVAEDQIPAFEIPTRKGSLPTEQQPVLRPSGRGGLASRPQPLAPPPDSFSRAALSSTSVSQLPPSVAPEQEQSQSSREPIFVRPGGRGGAGSRVKIVAKSAAKPSVGANHTTDTLKSSSLLARLQKRRLKSQLHREHQQSKGKSPEVNYGVHPVRDSLALRIVNGSSSTLSTIQFNSDPQPRPRFFPDEESAHDGSVRSHITLTSLAPEDMSWTPTNTFSSSNSDFISSTSMNETTDDESQHDPYYIAGDEEFQETRPTTPTYHHQRTLDKLTRTLGEAPTDLQGSREQTRPKLAITTATTSPSRNGKGKGVRRTSIALSVSSILLRPRRGSTTSESTMPSASEDLQLSSRTRWSDALSESRGLARDSYSTTPGSPMLFAAPSPSSLQERRQSRLASPQMRDLQEDDEEGNAEDAGDEASLVPAERVTNSDSCETLSSTSSPALSRSQSVTLKSASRRRSTWRPSHAQSASMSVLDAGTTSTLDKPPSVGQALPFKSHPIWLFPPGDDSDDPDRSSTAFSAMLRPQKRETTAVQMENPEHEQGWTGEWNNDLQEVIRNLRSLH